MVPELIEAQVLALATANLELKTAGMDPRPELMVPLVADVAELDAATKRMRGATATACAANGATLTIPIGVMIELPRAALTADRLVRVAVAEGRRARPDLGPGVCGVHAGDPISIRRLAAIGVDYVSCLPPRVPLALLETGRAAVLAESHATP